MNTPIQFLLRFAAVAASAASSLVAPGTAAPGVAVPELSITLRELQDDSLEQGEPLRVAVSIESSGDGNGRVELAPASGTWVDAVAVELRAASGGTVIARGTPTGSPDSPRATVDRERVTGGVWMFPASVMQAVARGDYLVRARLELKSGPGWTGEVTSEDVPFRMVGASSAPERVRARTFTRAQIAFSQGEPEAAARLLDEVLAKTPDDFELLCLRADVALAGRNAAAAMICLSRATRLRSPNASGPPPAIFHEVQSRVLAAQLAAGSPGAVPAWTWPPFTVLKLSEKEAAALLGKSASTAVAAVAPAIRSSTFPASTPTPTPVSAPPQNRTPGSSSGASSGPPKSVPTAGGLTPSPGGVAPVQPSIGIVIAAAELSDAAIRSDGSGQWAANATAGTQYGRTQYSASKATGAPDVPVAGNSPDAWCPASRDKGVDWLEVTFAKPVRAKEVRVRQNDAAGAITKVEAIEPDGTAHVWWEGVDPYKATPVREIAWFAVRVPATSYVVARVKLTLNLASGPGYKEIDAVQLVGAEP
jgi:hypothetical protein